MAIKRKEQLHKLPQELRSYIHQQMQDFQPFCLPDSQVAVDIVKRFHEDGSEDFLVTVFLTGDGVEVKSEGHDEDVYRATRSAKEVLLGYLLDVQREMLAEIEVNSQNEMARTGTGILH